MKAFTALRLRTENRHRALKLLLGQQAVSRTWLAKELGVSLPTACKLTDYFLAEGILKTVGQAGAELGRPAELVRLEPKSRIFAGVILDPAGIKAGLYDMLGSPLVSGSPPYFSLKQALDALPGQLLSLLGEVQALKIHGVGIGLPAVYNPESRVVEDAPTLGAYGLPVGSALDRLSARLGCPVVAGNDVNYSALGEFLHYPNQQDLVYISLGSSVGAAFVLDGRLLLGGRDRAGGIGYTLTAPGGPYLEQAINLAAVQAKFGLGAPGEIAGLSPVQKAEICSFVCEPLATCLLNLGATLDIRELVVGGLLPELLGSCFYEQLNALLAKCGRFPLTASRAILQDGGVAGAAMSAMDAALSGMLGGEQAM